MTKLIASIRNFSKAPKNSEMRGARITRGETKTAYKILVGKP